MRRRCLADRADRPIRRHPFAGGVDEGGGEPDQPAVAIDCGCLNGCDLVLTQALPDKVQTGGHLPTDAPWLADLLSEVCGFPNTAHDDQVDALSQALYWGSLRRIEPPL